MREQINANKYNNPQLEEMRDNEKWARKRKEQIRISGYDVSDEHWEEIFKKTWDGEVL